MDLKELEKAIEWYVDCVDFDEPKDRPYNLSPTLNPYKEEIFLASHSVFIEPEKVLCRMMLSKILHDTTMLQEWIDSIGSPTYTGKNILFWRIKPYLEDKGQGFVIIRARYDLVAEFEGKKYKSSMSIAND